MTRSTADLVRSTAVGLDPLPSRFEKVRHGDARPRLLRSARRLQDRHARSDQEGVSSPGPEAPPDVNPGDKKAEASFKEAQTAYDILSDPEKRKLFDQFGMAAFDSSSAGPRAGAAEWAARQAGGGGDDRVREYRPQRLLRTREPRRGPRRAP